MSPSNIGRRGAVQSMTIGAAGALLGSNALLAQSAKTVSPNEVLSIGLIGCGGRMRRLIEGLDRLPQTRIDAVCDVYDNFLRSTHAAVGGRDRDIFQTQDYRDILDRTGIDAVVIATPDHWHTPMTIDACEAGKPVYVEKPLTHSLSEGAQMQEVYERTGVTVQVGAQQRTMPHLVLLREKMQSGEIDLGPIHRIHMQWNRNHSPFHQGIPKITEDQVDWKRFLGGAPAQPFDPWRMRNWRWMWDFGNGPLADLMVHWLDCANWLLDLPMPKRVSSLGDRYTTGEAWETPDTIMTLFEYPEQQLLVDFECTFSNDHDRGSMRIRGEKGSLYIDRARWELVPQKQSEEPPRVTKTEVASAGKWGQGDYADYNAAALHLHDWLEAARDQRDPIDSVPAGIDAAAVCHYGNLALKERRVVEIEKA
ncbi:MAG: Gfo/Idh/MocA family oxidoreductase [Verrucomicrobiota bacterium]